MKTTAVIQNTLNFLMWIPYDFVEQIWANDPLKSHLVAKYNGYCRKEGYASANAILQFYNNLDLGNQEKFAEGIQKFIEDKNKNEEG